MVFIGLIIIIVVFFLHFKNKNDTIETIECSDLNVIVEDRLNPDIPKYNYIGQTVFLNWVSGKRIMEKEEYPQYFYYDYGILNSKKLHEDMIEEGFLQEGDIKTVLFSKNVEELKKILEKYQLKKTGKKVELVDRIIQNNVFSKIDTTNEVFELSEKGKQFIKKYQYILELRGTSISVEEFEKEKAKIEKPLFNRDIMWSIYNKHSLKEFYDKNYGLYRNTIFEMASFLEKENRHKQALLFELKGLYCDLSGKGNNNRTESKEELFIVNSNGIFKLKEYFSKEMLDSCWQVEFPFHYCDEKIFAEIVSDIFKGLNGDEIVERYKSKMKDTPKEAMLIDFEE